MDNEEDSITENDDLVSDETLENNSEEILESNLEESEDNTTINSDEYDIVLQVKPEKIPEIKSQIIDGQKCIVIPINDDEQTTVNGLDDLI